jgi:glycosyltransferase involved in cell wall biosynthesis
VIATSVEGIKEFVDHRETGYLVQPESPDELAEALPFTLGNLKEADEWGRTHGS